MYKDFKSKFSLICEEEVSRYRQGGFQNGDYIKILPAAIKHAKLSGHGSMFFDKIKEMMKNGLPTKISALKAERAETSNGLFGGIEAPTGFWADVCQEAAPGLFVNVITLPTDVLEVVQPEGNNFSPEIPDQWKRKDNSKIKPEEVDVKDSELEKQTSGRNKERNLTRKHVNNAIGKEAKDGRSQVDKPKKYKESVDLTRDEGLRMYPSSIKINGSDDKYRTFYIREMQPERTKKPEKYSKGRWFEFGLDQSNLSNQAAEDHLAGGLPEYVDENTYYKILNHFSLPTTLYPSGRRTHIPNIRTREQGDDDLYSQLQAAGVHLDNHESDLYAEMTPTSKAIIDKYHFKNNVTTFRSQIDGKTWYDIPFAFKPFWDKRQRLSPASSVKQESRQVIEESLESLRML